MEHRDPSAAREKHRLAELQCFNVLDTPSEPGFDAITRIASQIYNVPIALVSLIDESRQWFKSRLGLDVAETPRDISFCVHAIQYMEPFIVGDAAEHDLFRDNPLVTGEPYIRFYAGAPLIVSGGQILGTLCIIDRKPRVDFSRADAASLVELAGLVVGQLERRRAKADLAEAQHRLRQTKDSTARFLSNASHEIRTPLAAISSLMEIVVADAENSGQRDRLRRIQSMNQLLLEISDGVLDVSVSESGRVRRDRTVFNIFGVIDQVVDLLKFRAEMKNLKVVAHVASDVPPELQGDQTRLFQVLLNLVNNAIKYTESGFVTVSVAVKQLRARSVQLMFSVHDTGTGIAADKCEAIFKEFVQIGNETPAPGSAGLGLAISRRLVSLMGGQLSARSAVGRGSTFSFDAVFEVASSEPDDDAPDDDLLAGVPDLGGVRVLLVDDNEIIRETVTALLGRAAAAVVAVGDGAAAVQSVMSGEVPHDVVIMDIEMPGMDGFAATRKIRETLEQKDLPIVGLSAHISREMEVRAHAAGMNAYLRKPPKLLNLANTIRTVMGAGGDPDPTGEAPLIRDASLDSQARQMFQDRYANAPDIIRDSIDQGRFDEIATFLHSLRGAASFLGIRNLAETAGRLESAVKWRVLAEVPPMLDTFERQFASWLDEHSEGRRQGKKPGGRATGGAL